MCVCVDAEADALGRAAARLLCLIWVLFSKLRAYNHSLNCLMFSKRKLHAVIPDNSHPPSFPLKFQSWSLSPSSPSSLLLLSPSLPFLPPSLPPSLALSLSVCPVPAVPMRQISIYLPRLQTASISCLFTCKCQS